MDNISKLLQEAKPLYIKRKQVKRAIRYHAVALATIAVFTPALIYANANRIDLDALYAELYSNTTGEYYIDEFDAIGII